MTFDRRNLPDAVSYYESEGLKLTSRGKWRTTECKFHGGSDSMRICWRRFKIEPPCRLNFEPGLMANL